MSNEIAAISEENKVTKELLEDYLRTTHKELNDTQFKQFVAVSLAFGLNPWKKEVHPVVYKNKDGGYDLSIVTGYEVYLKRAEMNPNYDGFNIEFKGSFKRGKVTKQGKNGPWQVDALVPDGEVSCVCTVYRKDRAHPIREEVFFDEYDQGNSMWQSKPRTMLKKVAVVSAFRKAFPIDFGGMPYTNDELPDHMTGAEKLQEQGYTEVPTEMPKQVAQTAPVADDAEDFEAFKNAIVPLAHKNSQLYRMVMAAHKYKNLESIPRDSRREFFMELNQAINPPQQQQPKSAPTAAEQTEVQDV